MYRFNRPILYTLFAILLIGVGAFFAKTAGVTGRYSEVSQNELIQKQALAMPKGPRVTIDGIEVSVELATTSAAVQKGLSGRASLASRSGMLFIFSKPDIYRFWMPDMRFPLDIMWIEDGRVVDISANVSNEFDPRKPKFYSPRTPVRYVLEVNAGFAKQHAIEIGDPVLFSSLE